MSESRPLWRAAFDAVDRAVAPVAEQVVRTDGFADLVGLLSKVRHEARQQAERLMRQQWHFLNLPAGSDVKRLSEQVARLERQVRDLNKQLRDTDPGPS